MSKENKISTLIIIILVGFCFAVFYYYFIAVNLGIGYPYNTFLFQPNDRFSDFFREIHFNQDLNPYLGPNHIMEFPFLNFLGFIFSRISLVYSFIIFIILVTGFLFAACYYTLRIKGHATNWTNIIILTFLTFPFLYDIDRGNFDGIIFIILTLFIYFFINKRFLISAIFLSFAIAMKPFPAVLLILYIPEKKLREMIIVVLLTTFLSITPLLIFKGGFITNILAVISIPSLPEVNAAGGYFSANNFNYHSVSLFAISKFYFIETGNIRNINMPLFFDLYIKGVLLAFIPIGLYVSFIEKELWKQVTILTITMVIFPQLSGDYRLMYMFVPLFLFLLSENTKRADFFYTILFGLLMIPKSYYVFPLTITDSGVHDFTLSEPINVSIMVLILITIMISGILKLNANPFTKLANR